MRKIMYLIILGISIMGISILGGCHTTPDIPGFDKEAFQQDAGGCEGIRKGMKEKIFEIKGAFQGWGQEEVMELLGKPDKHELGARGQKSFVYYIEPSSECGQNNSKEPLTMYVRFSALNAVTEVSFKNY